MVLEHAERHTDDAAADGDIGGGLWQALCEFALDFDDAAIARGMGCEGVRISDPADLGPALQRALAARKPTVIDVQTSLEISFDDMTSPLAKAVQTPRVD